jgi:preprotein translocase subunit SecF
MIPDGSLALYVAVRYDRRMKLTILALLLFDLLLAAALMACAPTTYQSPQAGTTLAGGGG